MNSGQRKAGGEVRSGNRSCLKPILSGAKFFTAAALEEDPRKNLHVKFSNRVSITEFTLRTDGELLYKPDNSLQYYKEAKPDKTLASSWTRSLAHARNRALDLADGIGRIDDPEDFDVYRSEPRNVNDDKRRPLVREGDFFLTYVNQEDGYASYRRRPL